MEVDEAGHDVEAREIETHGASGGGDRAGRSDLDDATAIDAERAVREPGVAARIHDGRMFEEERRARCRR